MHAYQVKPGSKVDLSALDPSDKSLFDGSKADRVRRTTEQVSRLEASQEMLWAERRQKVLIVLQGMDTSGKDGVIRVVFEGVNPQGVRVAGFKVPTEEELDHDFLWRVHKQVPGRGEIVIFNRSHYEDVLVVRVHNLVPEAVWRGRYEQINAFEKMLADTGTTILKFFLHIDREEQKERLQARLDDPAKHWKFRLGDLKERALWNDYITAYEEALEKTSTPHAPWFVIPANSKSYRNLVIAGIIADTLEALDMRYPEPEENLEGVVID
jgi:PPK2 family polyphosphate:nucleotide phosphotransferase